MSPLGNEPTGSLSARLGFPETTIEVGPTHPASRHVLTASGTTASFLVDLDDDRMTGVEVEIGLGHRGFEKEAESRPWSEALPYVSRLGFATGVIAETGYCLAVESLAEVSIPDRAIWARMLTCELARVTDHFARLGALMAAIGLRDGEAAANAGEAASSKALGGATQAGPIGGFVCLGGVRRPFESGFEMGWPEWRETIAKAIDRFDIVATRNPTCLRRLRGIAFLGAEDAHALGVTGPILRAAGAATDVRRDRPYLAYQALDFEVPIGENGDALDRLLVVIEEIRQSLGMIDQCHKLLASLGPGEVVAKAVLERPVESILAERGEAREALATVETSTGELAFFVASDSEGRATRVRCRAPSFFHAQALPTMLEGERLDDLLPTVALVHLVGPECDR